MTYQTSWGLLQDAIAEQTDSKLRANLAIVARHVVAEVEGDLETLMCTLVDEPIYSVWGTSTSVAPCGRVEVEQHYKRLIASGKNRLDYHISRVTVDARTVVTEGQFSFAYRGAEITGSVTQEGESVHADEWYLVVYQCLVVWPISADGLIEGEEIYTGEVAQPIRRLAKGECPHLGPIGR